MTTDPETSEPVVVSPKLSKICMSPRSKSQLFKYHSGVSGSFIHPFRSRFMEMLKDLSLLMIDPAAIEWMPESIARECCVLPVSRTADSIHVVFPVGSNSQHEELLSKLQFLLACKISYDIADNELIAPAIIRHYGAHYSEIENCNPEFQFRCPKRWALLSSTIHSDVRFCSECSQNVFFCHSDEELQNRVLQGQCVAFYKYEEIVMGLIDFCSLNVTDTDPPSHEAFQ